MSSAVAQSPGKVRLTVDEYKTIIDTGVFKRRHVQLLDGELVEVTKGPRHDFTVSELARWLRKVLPERAWVVREEKVIEPWPYWWPEPDLTVARGPGRRYQHRYPGRGDIAILVEVCETSQYEDRIVKFPAYAKPVVPQYWIVDIRRRAVEVYTDPVPSGRPPRYATAREFPEDGLIPVVIEGKRYRSIRVSDILPAQV
jgi:Uma2 family endonuclease